MKKTYIMPSLKVKEIKIQGILTPNSEVELTPNEETSSGDAKSSWGDVWDAADE